jgi:hypothetical protein
MIQNHTLWDEQAPQAGIKSLDLLAKSLDLQRRTPGGFKTKAIREGLPKELY